MSLPPEVWARVDEIEAKLAELDPILQSFCARRGFRFSTMVDENRTLWPRRGLTAREEIFRGLYLTMDLTVQEVMDRGFYPEMPWSLYADATFMPARSEPTRILSKKVLNAVPCSLLPSGRDSRKQS